MWTFKKDGLSSEEDINSFMFRFSSAKEDKIWYLLWLQEWKSIIIWWLSNAHYIDIIKIICTGNFI